MGLRPGIPPLPPPPPPTAVTFQTVFPSAASQKQHNTTEEEVSIAAARADESHSRLSQASVCVCVRMCRLTPGKDSTDKPSSFWLSFEVSDWSDTVLTR